MRLIVRLFRRLLCGLDGGFGWVGLYFGLGFSCSYLLRARMYTIFILFVFGRGWLVVVWQSFNASL